MVTIEIEAEIPLTEEEKAAIDRVPEVLDKVAQMEELPDVSVSLTLVSKERIQEINREYREKDSPTDVLSFPLFENRSEWSKEDWEETIELGDIILSLPIAGVQAIEYGHSLLREISFLVVHGFLHLLGYDHETKEEEEEMFGLQEKVLSELEITR
ncbi:rRNA maturation RNase YbeY [Shimazuella sp. AN120528]|uniref:rRNA maturation RNase YbeY n=1 Tax=Shimazuella soli TaxID=1892854 RepID=UPI001F1103C1|nr:rRNA maturation RNase YbeY [Shimazuella soli]MCH5583878.1 rRNA maturation RNase YbeY [Shimazuella soli]